jgi:hypothetical protein
MCSRTMLRRKKMAGDAPDVYTDRKSLQSWQDAEHTFLSRVSIYFADDIFDLS